MVSVSRVSVDTRQSKAETLADIDIPVAISRTSVTLSLMSSRVTKMKVGLKYLLCPFQDLLC